MMTNNSGTEMVFCERTIQKQNLKGPDVVVMEKENSRTFGLGCPVVPAPSNHGMEGNCRKNSPKHDSNVKLDYKFGPATAPWKY